MIDKWQQDIAIGVNTICMVFTKYISKWQFFYTLIIY